MSKTIDTLLFAGGLALAAVGAYELLVPRESQRNKIEQAALMMETPQAQDYAQRTLPDTTAYYGGALLGMLGLKRLERRDKQ